MRREDLLKPDVMSEVILLGFGVVIFAILLLILVAAWTQAPGLDRHFSLSVALSPFVRSTDDSVHRARGCGAIPLLRM